MNSLGQRRYDHRAPVWVVEDSALYRDTLAALIDRSDRFRCAQMFGDGQSAVQALNDTKDLPRVILMDLALAGMNGI